MPDLDPSKSWMITERGVVVNVTSISRPIGKTDYTGFTDPVRPLLGFEVKKEEFCGVPGQRRQILTVGRPRIGKTESIVLAKAIAKELTTRGFDATAHVSKVLDTMSGAGTFPNILLLVFPRPEGPQGEFKLEAELEAKTKNKSSSIAKP